MSFILDALTKLERERRQTESGGVASSPTTLGRNRWRPWQSIGVMAGVALVSGVLTASLLRVLTPTEASSEATESEPAPPLEVSRASSDLPAPEPPPTTTRLNPRVESGVAPSPPARSVALPPPPQEAESTEQTPLETEEDRGPEPSIRLVGHGSPPRSVNDVTSTPPATHAEEGFPQLVLQGTSVIDGAPVAVISDRRVFEGDHIDGAVVIRIGERIVELEFDGQRFTLSL